MKLLRLLRGPNWRRFDSQYYLTCGRKFDINEPGAWNQDRCWDFPDLRDRQRTPWIRHRDRPVCDLVAGARSRLMATCSRVPVKVSFRAWASGSSRGRNRRVSSS
jgi:hypothetical protein